VNFRWIAFVAARYLSRRRRNRASSPSPALAVLGIAVGVLALTVIIAVMNGFQMGYIESILEVSSYHIRVDGLSGAGLDPQADQGLRSFPLAKMAALPQVRAALPFRELRGLIRGRRAGQQAALIRGLPADALEQDRGMAARLDCEAGSFDLAGENSILLGAELARSLGVMPGDEVTLISLAGVFSGEADNTPLIVRGIFRTGFYEYDLGWGFIGLDRAAALVGGNLSLGVKLANRWRDEAVLRQLGQVLGDSGLPWTLLRENGEGQDPASLVLSSWRDYNRAFFGALRTEKLMMFVLVGLIFIVVGLNIFQSQRRTVLERREEIGLLRAVGARDYAVRLVFTCDGLFLGLVGAGLGLALGLLVSFHIGLFFSLIEALVNGVIGALNFAAGSAGEGRFAIFSPAVFYIKQISARVIPHEALLIFMFGFLSAVLAAFLASGRVSKIKPAEVLRYE
jgi:lipoprotein-releasing system permease protein